MAIGALDSAMFGDMFGTAAMRAAFGELAFLARCAEVEAALARAQARLGIVPGRRRRGDLAGRRRDRRRPGVARSRRGSGARPRRSATRSCRWCASWPSRPATAGRYLHWGATTQDIMDTAAVLQIRDGLALIEADLDAVRGHLAGARAALPRHADGRAHPSAARAADHLRLQGGGVARRRSTATPTRLAELQPRVLVGAVRRRRRHPGLARRGRGGLASCAELARELGLGEPPITWHVARDGIAETVQFLALLGGSLGKIAFDIMLMSATEFGEAAEPFVAGPRLVLDDAAEAQPDLVRADPRRRQGAAPACRAGARRDGQRFRARHRPLACRMDRAAGELRLRRRRLASGAISCSAG